MHIKSLGKMTTGDNKTALRPATVFIDAISKQAGSPEHGTGAI